MNRKTTFEGMLKPPPEVSGSPHEQGAPIVLDGHGTIHTGLGTDRDGNPIERPYIWLWIEPVAQADCNEYRWYQFFKPTFYILDENGNRGDPETNIPEFPAATGLKFRFNRWNPDYHKVPSQQEDEQRRRDGKPKTPKHRPSHLRPPAGGPKYGKPFVQTGVPGSNPNGTTPLPGLFDGPNFSNRPEPDKKSPIETIFLKKIRPRQASGENPPPPGTAVVEVEVEFQTCLACIDDGEYKCIYCLTWTYTERSTLRTEWTEDTAGSSTPEAGIVTPERHWKLGVRVIDVDARIHVNGQAPCD